MGIDYVYRKKHVRLVMSAYDFFGSVFRRRRAPKPTALPKHVCFVILHQIGDVVMSLPTVRAIMLAAPGARFSVIAGSATAPIIRLAVAADVDVHEFNAAWQYAVQASGQKPEEAKAGFLALVEKVSADVAVVFHPDLTVNQLLGRSRGTHTIGFANAGGGFFLSNGLVIPSKGYQVERNFALAKEFGNLFAVQIPALEAPKLQATAEDVTAIKQLLPEGEFVAVHPFGRFNSRNWAASKWQELFGWFCSQGLIPVVVGGPNDEADVFGGNLHCGINLAGRLSLPQTAALMSVCRMFVGIDSGPGHIAAAVGCPVISIFSSANTPDRWSPYPGYVRVLYDGNIDRSKWPLEARELPPGMDDNPYTSRISAEQVIEEAKEILRLQDQGELRKP